MKKLILTVSAVMGLSMVGFTQGIQFADFSSAANAAGGYDTTIGGAPNNTADLNLELLYGTTASTVNGAVVTLLLSSSANPSTGTIGGTYTAAGDISAIGGAINDNSQTIYSLPLGTYFFQVEAWTGSYSTYAAALAASQGGVAGAYAGASSVFSAAIAASPAPPADISGVGIINLTAAAVPEPSTLAMAGVGLASMLMFRRRNK